MTPSLSHNSRETFGIPSKEDPFHVEMPIRAVTKGEELKQFCDNFGIFSRCFEDMLCL
jgi:hypothetical protein